MAEVMDASSLRTQLAQDAKALNLVEFWTERADIELTQPRRRAVPYRWQWSEIHPRLQVASRTVPIEECERRALVFANPGLGGKPYITHSLFAAYSLYNPGERAPVHRHTPCASRFVLEGDGGFTTVAGEKLTMGRGDLIITPHGCWHDHGNEGTRPVIWVDVLDVPLLESLNTTMFEFDYSEQGQPRTTQSITAPADYSTRAYSRGGLLPTFVSHRRGTVDHSPMLVYRWEHTRQALLDMEGLPGSPHDAITVEYVNPANGHSVMPTMSFRSTLLRAREQTQLQRRSSSSLFVVLEGAGSTEVGDTTLDWKANDVFCIPAWQWYRHKPAGGRAVLYSVTDEPVLRKLGLFRWQGQDAQGQPYDLEIGQ